MPPSRGDGFRRPGQGPRTQPLAGAATAICATVTDAFDLLRPERYG